MKHELIEEPGQEFTGQRNYYIASSADSQAGVGTLLIIREEDLVKYEPEANGENAYIVIKIDNGEIAFDITEIFYIRKHDK